MKKSPVLTVLIVIVTILNAAMFIGDWIIQVNIRQYGREQQQTIDIIDLGTPNTNNLHSLDFDGEEAEYLMKIANIKATLSQDTPLNKARAIMVTINRAYNEDKSIYDVCVEAAAESGFSEEEFVGTIINNNDLAGYNIVMYDHFDDTNGALDYSDVIK